MPSATDICNLALSHLGDDSNVAAIDPPEATPEASYCAVFYPMARDETLERHSWGFATGRKALTLLDETADGWGYVYAAPSDLLHPQALFASGYERDNGTDEFTIEVDDSGQQIILTDTENAVLRYTRKITDTSKFTPLFVLAVSWSLAGKLAGPILKGDAGRIASKECLQGFEYQLGLASQSDANGQRVNASALPDWIEARS